MLCPTCGCENSDGSATCSVCGNALNFNNYEKSKNKTIPKPKNKKIAPVIVICISAVAILVVVAIIVSQLIITSNTYQTNASEYISSSDFVVAVNNDGTVSCDGAYDLSEWNDIKAVAAGESVIVGLKNDGTVIAADSDGEAVWTNFENDISKWENIVSICAEKEYGAVAGLKSNGTVVIADTIGEGLALDTSYLENVVQIDLGFIDGYGSYICALKEDGTVEIVIPDFTEFYDSKEEIDEAIKIANDFLNVSEWKNIKSIYCDGSYVFGITKSGKLQMTLNSKLIEQYYMRPQLNLYINDKEQLALYNQRTNVKLKMIDDMIERLEKLKVSQVAVSPYNFSFFDFNFLNLYYIGNYNNESTLFLLLEDGTIVAESPLFSLYYACKNLSGDALYNKANEYTHIVFDYEDFFDYWNEYCNKCENIINNVHKFKNVIAIDTCINYGEECYDDTSLIVLKNDGTVYSTYKHSEVNQWSNIKTTEKKHTEFTTKDKKIDEPNKNFDGSNVDTSPVETSGITNKNFYKGKYYLTYDENGEFVIYAFEIVDDNIIRVTYYEPPDFSNYTFVDAYYAERKDNKLYNQDIGFEFIIDANSQKIKYKDENRANYESLKEVDDLSEETLKKYAEEVL